MSGNADKFNSLDVILDCLKQLESNRRLWPLTSGVSVDQVIRSAMRLGKWPVRSSKPSGIQVNSSSSPTNAMQF